MMGGKKSGEKNPKQQKQNKQTTEQEKKKRKDQLGWGLTKHSSAHLLPVARFGSHQVEDVALD